MNRPLSPEAQAAIEETARRADIATEQLTAAFAKFVEASEKMQAVLASALSGLLASDEFREVVRLAQEYEAKRNGQPDGGA